MKKCRCKFVLLSSRLRTATLTVAFLSAAAFSFISCAPSINVAPDGASANQSGSPTAAPNTAPSAASAATGANAASGSTVFIDAGSSGAAATGTLRINMPAISSLVSTGFASIGAQATANNRAYIFNTGTKFVLKDESNKVVDSWSITPVFSSIGASVSVARQIPAGGTYTLTAEIFNSIMSTTVPRVIGSASGISVLKDDFTTAQVYGIPNPSITTDLTSTVSGTLLPVKLNASGMEILAMGGEAWYKIVPSAEKTSIAINHDYAPDIGYAMILYDHQGKRTGFQRFDDETQQGSLIAPVVPGDTYYLGIALRDDTDPTSTPFTLTLTEDTNLITNGDFSSVTDTGWILSATGSSTASMNVVETAGNREMKIEIDNGGSPMQDFAFYRNDLYLESGKTYRFGFTARIDTGTLDLSSIMGVYPSSEWIQYGAINNIQVSPTLMSFEGTAYISGATTAEGMIVIQLMGAAAGVDLYLDNFFVVEITPPFLAPANLTATPTGRNVTLNWNAVDGAVDYVISYEGAFTRYNGSLTVNSLSWVAEGLWYDTDFSFRVSARSPAGTGSPAILNGVRTTGETVSGTIADAGINGEYALIIRNDAKGYDMSGMVTLAEGAGTFSIAGGEPTSLGGDHFFAWLDVETGPWKSGYLNPGDLYSYAYAISDVYGEILGMNFPESTWESVGELPIASNATLDGTTATLTWWDLAGRSAYEVVIERRIGYGGTFEPFTPISTSGWVGSVNSQFFSNRSAQDSGPLDAALNYTYRIGVDLNNSGGALEEGEYMETAPIGNTG